MTETKTPDLSRMMRVTIPLEVKGGDTVAKIAAERGMTELEALALLEATRAQGVELAADFLVTKQKATPVAFCGTQLKDGQPPEMTPENLLFFVESANRLAEGAKNRYQEGSPESRLMEALVMSLASAHHMYCLLLTVMYADSAAPETKNA